MKATYQTLLLAALFLLCCHNATAQQQQQRDTIQGLDVRYYRNCYWLDTTRPSYFSHPIDGFGGIMINRSVQYCRRVAYRFVPDRPLNIIGVAGAMTLQHLAHEEFQGILIPDELRDSVIANRQTEYFELYGTRVYDSVGNVMNDADTLMLLGSLPWTLTDTTRFISLPIFDITPDSILIIPIIERYFPKPIRIDTTFYLGHTNHNNGYIHYVEGVLENGFGGYHQNFWVGSTAYYYSVPPLGVTTYRQWGSQRDTCTTTNNLHDASPNIFFQEYSSNEDTYVPWRHIIQHHQALPLRSRAMPLLFPIVDTTGLFRPEELDSLVCDTVQGFRVLSQQDNAASFAWSPDNAADVWQLSWGEEGIAPEEGTLAYATNNVKSVVGLQDSVVYTAFVRARCNDTLFSEWSAPLRFWKGMNDTTGVGLQPTNTVEQLTYLYPNPAENSVTVASSFSMSRVELFALDGTRLLSHPTQGIMTQIDLTPFPKGSYMLRITTPAGTAIKKLIIQ